MCPSKVVRGDGRFSGDYDGDGKADLIIWRASTATFWVYTSAMGSVVTKQLGGLNEMCRCQAITMEMGKTDFAVWRPATGAWLVVFSSNGISPNWQWGSATDVPVPGDYDGDGKTDLAIWRPSNGTWMIYQSSGGTMTTQWGAAGDVPLAGDFDGDGRTDLAVWRASTATFWIYSPATNTDDEQAMGRLNGCASAGRLRWRPQDRYRGVWRPSNGTWMICNSSNGATATGQWGNSTDVPVPGDYDGDGKTDLAIWRPASGMWWIFKSTGGTLSLQWGTVGDVPVR